MADKDTLRIKIAGEVDQSLDRAAEHVDSLFASIGAAVALGKVYDAFMQCSEAASEYETALKKAESIADTSVTSMSSIKSEITALSFETGVSAADLSESAYNAISASVDTANAVSFISQANELAVGGFTDATTAVDVLTTAINAYKLSADDAGKISDYLIMTQNKGKTTVDELASSMGKVIPLAAAYSVQMDNLSTAYAITTANGIATAEATTYIKSMLNELSDTGSEVSKTLLSETGYTFTQLNEQGRSLGDVLTIIGDSVNGDATAFSNLWSSSEGATAALSLYGAGAEEYNSLLGEMQNSAGATAKAYELMSETTEFAHQKMVTGAENVSIAVGEVLNPALGDLYNKVADIEERIAGFIGEHPELVAAFASAATAVGVVTAGVTAYTAVTGAASVATKAFTAAWNANPLFLAITSIAAVTTAIYGAVKAFDAAAEKASDVSEDLTVTSRQQQAELDALKNKYDEVCEKQGENSYEAKNLKEEIDRLTKTYEENKETIGALLAESDELIKKAREQADAWKDNTKAIESDTRGELELINMLRELGGMEMNPAVMEQMEAIIDELNKRLPGLGLSYDDVAQNTDKATASAEKYIETSKKQQELETASDTWVEALQTKSDLELQIDDIKVNKEAVQEEIDKKIADLAQAAEYGGPAELKYLEYKNYGVVPEDIAREQKELDEYDKKIKELEKSLEENERQLKAYSKAMDDASGKSRISGRINSEYAKGMEAAQPAISSMRKSLENLAADYDLVYKDAYKSIDSQIGLFSEMKSTVKITTDDMMKAFKSQERYLNQYSKNIKKASKIGLDDEVLSQLSDGSAEAAGQLDVIVKKYKELEKTDGKKAAERWVKDFNKQFNAVEKGKEKFADTVSRMENDFNESMQDMVKDAKSAIKDMDLSDEAYAAAEKTINAYIKAINDKTADVSVAASGLAANIPDIFGYGEKKANKKAKQYTKKNGVGDVVPNATGDIITRPTLALVAEAGDDEAIIPINKTKRSYALWEETGRRLGVFEGAADNKKTASGSLKRLNNHAGQGASEKNTSGKNEGGMKITFSPVINISGDASKKEVTEGFDKAFAEFKKMMGKYNREIMRTGAGSR